uniref:Uncharacterized protein n=1 Tax=Denticeps clupeoides TaxID=299321 RepID=A0AAY4BQF5_9TELE
MCFSTACDFLGEKLAGFLGLNSPKYQYAIDVFHRDQKNRISLRKKNEYGATSSAEASWPSRPSGVSASRGAASHNGGHENEQQ